MARLNVQIGITPNFSCQTVKDSILASFSLRYHYSQMKIILDLYAHAFSRRIPITSKLPEDNEKKENKTL